MTCASLVVVERTTWTDERLDDLSREMCDGFGRVDSDIRRLETNMEHRFAAVDRRFDVMDLRFEAMDRRFNSLESRIAWFGGGLMLTMVGVILSNLV